LFVIAYFDDLIVGFKFLCSSICEAVLFHINLMSSNSGVMFKVTGLMFHIYDVTLRTKCALYMRVVRNSVSG
jgi:hypothetical protein